MPTDKKTIHIVGAGLAGSECAFQLAEMGYNVVLYEMRPNTMTPAHKTSNCAELVCSNSFGSQTDYSAPGQLKWEAEQLGSLNLKMAREAAVPSGMALGVDREVFSNNITKILNEHPNICIEKTIVESIDQVPRPAVIATGPLTHEQLAHSILDHLKDAEDKEDFLYFYDAIAPVIDADSIDMNIAFRADRWGKGNGDYINCPLTKEQYYAFINEIKNARKVEPKEFEKTNYFEGCMPIEVMVERGDDTPRFGPMAGKGLFHPVTDRYPYAAVQLRQDNLEGTAYNMVGFQTKMAYGEQVRVFKTIPGLENAEFLKLGSIHRNMFINSPKKLTKHLSSRKDDDLYFAGQITGVEGYFESTCVGLLIAKIIDMKEKGQAITLPPRQSALGSLINAITVEKEDFQPTNINFGLLPPLSEEEKAKFKQKRDRKDRQLAIAKEVFQQWLANN